MLTDSEDASEATALRGHQHYKCTTTDIIFIAAPSSLNPHLGNFIEESPLTQRLEGHL